MIIYERLIHFGNENLVLTNQRLIYWPKLKTIILSDLHLGKAAHFRKNGIPVPGDISKHDLNRLAILINHYQAQKVIIVGDLIHAGANTEVEFFKELTENHLNTIFILIKGNHDQLTENRLKLIGINEVYDELCLENIHFIHQPSEVLQPNISGHIHPGVSLEFATKNRMRLPCYVVTEKEIILPAFSLFTGLDTFSLPIDGVFYAFSEEGIFELNKVS